MFSLLFFLFVGSELALKVSAYPNCTIQWSDPLPSWYPIVFNTSGIIYPTRTYDNEDWRIVIARSSNVKVGCGADTSNTVQGYENEVVLRCIRAGLRIGSQPANFSNLGCTKQVKEQLVTTGNCFNDSTAVDILFQSNSTRLPLINLCHDTNIDSTIYSHHFIIGAALNPYEVSNNRPSFKEGQFYTQISANGAYGQSSQKNQVALLVGSQTIAEKYINVTRSYYFARGHLAPDGDFVHVYEQNSTYYYINVCPQWQAINNGNWKALETSLRNYAKGSNTNLEVWTGGKDVLKLDDVHNNPVEIYLSRDSSQKLRLPVPELIWKVIKDTARNASVAVFMVNNPHLTEIPARLRLCSDVCSQISWVTWDTRNIQKGYTYCCELRTTTASLPYIPTNLNAPNLMT